ncbi:BAG family molecular chaperone regulator 7 [Vitis vinifera]|uniref:BAG family molecular chaperone regulator 7 n=1 Tax=Vitis vinifera TaxID=29760 RepID=A0A438CMC4_VITVI|nr:BAG family molecular chaperone regulator 7 [Vitis vinifera]
MGVHQMVGACPSDADIAKFETFEDYEKAFAKRVGAVKSKGRKKECQVKEIRVLFNNYRRRVTDDAEERQRISEKIIVLLIHVDDIEGADLMVRAAKRSIVDELEAMLEVVDPLPPGRTLSMRRRMFDMPSRVIQKELAEGVAQVVQMLDQEENGAAFEACL